MPGKRSDVISWDEFFMRVALAASLRSKDPNTQVGACIAGPDNRILSVGYNGTPTGINDDDFPWDTTEDPLTDKHNYVIHAEANAILNYRGALKELSGARVYVTLFPCQECAKMLAQAGIGEVIYLDDKYRGTIGDDISRSVLDKCGVVYRKMGLPEEVLQGWGSAK
ncbi:MAG: dCMP deaminase family protein [Atopobiaceae bacterium]|nr:dCMP deaminase family protein [Atopobiaceae bacterium]